MVLLICLVCIFSTFGGILLGQSVKAALIFSKGLEKGQRIMLAVGAVSVILAIALSILSLWIPDRLWS